jgi:tetratricopeptide (TPR) repeat protein
MKASGLLLLVACLASGSNVLHAHGVLVVQIRDVSTQIEKQPTAALFLRRGELEREHCEYERALVDYQKAAELDPKMDVVFLCRGKALLEAGRPAPAREALDRFLSTKPDHGDGYLTRARVLVALNDFALAADDFTRSIEHTKEPRPEHFLERALALEQAGDPDSAVAGLEEGMKRLGPITTLQEAAVAIEMKQRLFDAAMKRMDSLIGQATRKESWQARKADLLVQAGRPDQAQRAYRESLASIESLPPRLRSLQPMQDLEKAVRAALAGFPAEKSLPHETLQPKQTEPDSLNQ